MAFNGRATYDNPTVIEPDVSNLLTIYSRMETPFLDYIGDSDTAATQIIHGWVEDALIPNVDTMNDAGGISNVDGSMTVSNGGRFTACPRSLEPVPATGPTGPPPPTGTSARST